MNGAPSFLALIHNVSLLLAMALLFDLIVGVREYRRWWLWQVVLGLVLGGAAIALMMTPWMLSPGIIFDTRTVLLGISGLFFGTLPTLMAMAMALVYRFSLGGTALWMGLTTILTSGLIGILWRRWLNKPLDRLNAWDLYRFGLVVHLVMLLCAFTLPLRVALDVLDNIVLPVLLIYPLGTLLLGLLMVNRLRRERIAVDLKRNEARMHSLVEILQQPVQSVREFLDFALHEALRLTESQVGYLFFYAEETQQFSQGLASRSAYAGSSIVELPENFSLSQAGLLGEVVRQRKAVIVNNLAEAFPAGRGLPVGHIPIRRYLGTPVFSNGKIVAVVGVGNKEQEYDDTDAIQLALLMDGIWKAAERRQAEALRSESEARYEAIVENLPGGFVAMLDRDLRVLFSAGEAMAQIGLTDDMLAGRKIHEVPGLEAGEDVARQYRRVLEGETVHFEMKLAGRDFGVHAVPLRGDQGEVVHILSLSIDITERKHSLDQLRQAQVELERLFHESELSRRALLSVVEDQKRTEEKIRQLNLELEERVRERTAQYEAANRELEAFAYSVSHDLRAPLRAMDGFSGALLEEYQDRLDDQARHYLKRIREASQRMGQLIEDLLNLSRVTRREMARKPVDLSQMAREIADELQSQHPGRQVAVEVMPDLMVEVDPNLMKIALENLLSNAFKFTARREEARINVGVVEKGGEKIYYIRDNGIGFDMAYASKLFTPFQRLHSLQDFPGTGVGLATVQRIIQRHGGRIWPEAEPGVGATFYFTLGASE
ncbi:protein containing PAS domain S-box [Anaerolinea thermolimosa]|nr:LytS/YhcK type 5TM receptor domain-containing protein [Anaerolinea thermolimosa]GAP07801.1 protein containing PAS domain S-box [Anaerolinea thermolimosa]